MSSPDDRRLSSRVVSEHYMSQQGIDNSQLPPEGTVKYVEVPVIEEVIKHVKRVSVVDVERIVPKYETEWVNKYVDVPQTQVVERMVEVPQIEEIIRQVPRHQVIEVPREVVRHVPKVEIVTTERIVEVPGQIIEIPKPYTVENPIPVPNYIEKQIPTVVAQTIHPVINESTTDFIDVDLFEYTPEIIVVDVMVPKLTASQLIPKGMISEKHVPVEVPAAQYNTLLNQMNVHLLADAIPYIRDVTGQVCFLPNVSIMSPTTSFASPPTLMKPQRPQQPYFPNTAAAPSPIYQEKPFIFAPASQQQQTTNYPMQTTKPSSLPHYQPRSVSNESNDEDTQGLYDVPCPTKHQFQKKIRHEVRKANAAKSLKSKKH